ncbi:MAG: hypothetical protein ACYC3I_18065 [Gemmataceae bacterium]
MNLVDLLHALDSAGIRLLRSDDNLHLRGKVNALSPAVIDAAKAHKQDLLPLLDGEEASPSRLLSARNGLPHSLESPAAGYRLIVDALGLAEVEQAIRRSERIAIDTETTGLDPRRDRVRLIQLALESGVFIVDVFAVNPTMLWPALAGKELVLHNAAFDALFLQRLGLNFSTVTIHDTMILSVLLTAGDFRQRNSLEAIAERHLDYTLDKTHQKSDWSGELTSDMLDYAGQDAIATRDVYELLQRDIDASGLRNVADLEHRCLPAVLWMSNAGVGFDREAWLILAEKAESEETTLGHQLKELAPPKPAPKKPTKSDALTS